MTTAAAPPPSAAWPSGSATSARRGTAGVGVVVARARGERTVLAEAHATSPLRFVCPTFAGTKAAAVCLVSFGGGLVDGDAIDVHLTVESGATLVLFTQASTKVFRGSSSQRIRADVEGTLVLLPDPVAPFAGARYAQEVDVALRGEGGCVLLDGFTSGRPAFGERWALARLGLVTSVSHEGRVVVRDALELDERDGPVPERMGRFEAIATLVAVGARAAPIARSILEGPRALDGEATVAASAIARAEAYGLPGAIARAAATSPARALAEARRMIRNLPEIEAVDPYTARY